MNTPADNTGESLTIQLPDDVKPIDIKIDWVVKPHKRVGGIETTDHAFSGASWWENLIFSLTGKLHWYEIELTYYREMLPDGTWAAEKFTSRTFQHGTASRRSLAFEHRHELHKQLAPSLMKDMPREKLTNGMLKLTRIEYLGRW